MLAPDLLHGLDPGHDLFAVEAADRLLNTLADRGGSDLHLLPVEAGYEVRIRIEGRLQPLCRIAVGGPRVVTRLKVLADLLTYESDRPQEGRVVRTPPSTLPAASTKSDLDTPPHTAPPHTAPPHTASPHGEVRLATCPTVFGEKAVLRQFAPRRSLLTLDHLGLSAVVLSSWRAECRRPSGLLLVTGPAGSGKTTTAYATIRGLMSTSEESRSVVSLEDPVEQVLPGVAQTAVGGHTPMTFAGGLRAVMRHDPEVLFVGELRDRDTVETALTAALTGHLVLSTLHTGGAAEAVVRLLDAGIEPFLILSGLRAVMHQRLVRTPEGRRLVVAELLTLDDEEVRAAVRDRDPRRLNVRPTVLDQAAELHAARQISDGEYARLTGRPT